MYYVFNLHCSNIIFTIYSKINNVFLSSLVPVIGFTLSTLSLNAIRKLWEKNIK